MNRHYREGFQRVFLNDLNDVEKQLQEYDPQLYLMWNPNTNQHLIVDGMFEIAVMRIPQKNFPLLTSRVVDHIKSIRVGGGYSASREVEAAEAARERENARRTDDLAYNLAKDMYKPVKNLAYYGAV